MASEKATKGEAVMHKISPSSASPLASDLHFSSLHLHLFTRGLSSSPIRAAAVKGRVLLFFFAFGAEEEPIMDISGDDLLALCVAVLCPPLSQHERSPWPSPSSVVGDQPADILRTGQSPLAIERYSLGRVASSALSVTRGRAPISSLPKCC